MASHNPRGDESQATQLLNAALQRNLSPPNDFQDMAKPSLSVGESAAVHEASSSDTNGRDSVPQYHFHGLAATQTQSQYASQLEGEDSQKENTPTSWERSHEKPVSPDLNPDEWHHSPPKRPSRNITSRPAKADQSNTKETLSRPVLAPPTSKQAKEVAFLSPGPPSHNAPLPSRARERSSRTSRATARTAQRRREERSASPASVDSFADQQSEDLEKRYLETAEVFHVPLSELTRHGEGSRRSTRTRSPLPIKPTRGTRNMSASSREDSGALLPDSVVEPLHGQILVEATPSDSSRDSQSQGVVNDPQQTDTIDSHAVEDTQLSDSYAQGQGQEIHFDVTEGLSTGTTGLSTQVDDSQTSTEPSSSYERILNMDPFEPELQPTQPNTQHTQPVNDDVTHPAAAGDTLSTQNAIQPTNQSTLIHTRAGTNGLEEVSATIPSPAIASWGTSGGTRVSIADTARDPLRRARLKAMMNARPLVVPGQETQPSDALAVHGSIAVATDRQIAPPLKLKDHETAFSRDADMDIVPDSEATQADVNHDLPSSAPPSPVRPKSVPRPSRFTPSEEAIVESTIIEADEDDTDEDEDVPLAAVVRASPEKNSKELELPQAVRTTRQPRSKSANKTLRDDDMSSTTTTHHVQDAIPRRLPDEARAQKGRSWETTVVPSSKPREDDDHCPVTEATPKRIVSKSKQSAPANSTTKTRRTAARSRTPSIPLERKRRTIPVDDYSSDGRDSDIAIPEPEDEGEVATELADDDYMDIESTTESARKSSTRKRKRVATRSSAQKGSTRSSRTTAASPIARAAKKLKPSSTVRTNTFEPTRVFALWKQDSHFYPGIVHSMVCDCPARYRIEFDDGTSDTVDLTKMRLCDLRANDHVLLAVAKQRLRYTVINVAGCDMDSAITLEWDDGHEVQSRKASLKDIRIASRTLQSEWKNRVLTVSDITPIIQPKFSIKPSPSPSKASMASGGSSSKNSPRILAKTGFIVTLSPGNDNWEKDKDRLVSIIKANGGVVIEDWLDIFSMEGTHIRESKRWVAGSKDVKWMERRDIERVFLLSDDCSQKPKFLIALALGIPCVSVEWLNAVTETAGERDWQPFLLPAGYCDTLSVRVSQLVDLDWGNSIEHLTEIMSNPVTPKLFADKSILCVAPDWVPISTKAVRRNNTDNEKAKESTRMVPRIILSMGAARVEAVPELKSVSSQDLTTFDLVVVKEQSDVTHMPRKSPRCVHFQWVKDCLIAGRLLPYPDAD